MSASFNDPRARRWGNIAKYGALLGVGLLVAPYVWLAIGGLIGLLVAGGIFGLTWMLRPWLFAKAANLRLALIKSEAAKNPVETLQAEHLRQSKALEERKLGVERLSGSIRTLDQAIDTLQREFPDSPELPQMRADQSELVALEQSRIAEWREAYVTLGDFAKEIKRAGRLWDVAQAAAAARQQSGLTEDEWTSKLKTETSIDAIRAQLNKQLSALSVERMQADADRVLKSKAAKALPAASGATIDLPASKSGVRATLVIVALLLIGYRETSAQPVETFIRGEMAIRFDTRTQRDGDSPKDGVTDKYKLRVNVSNSVVFDGTIEALPYIKGMLSSQAGSLTHAIECFVVNPQNHQDMRNIGRIYGKVPVDAQNVYRFDDGDLRIGVFGDQRPEGRARGLALGKPPAQGSGLLSRIKREAMSLTRLTGGKAVSLTVTRYDKMEFQAHVLPSGPLGVYPETTISGPMIYDYDRSAWFINGVTATYNAGGKLMADRLTGNIRWIESPQYKTQGGGEYQFDIRVNEPAPSEASMFQAPADESAFFAQDVQIPGLVGTMKYKDTMTSGVISASLVAVDLKGNQLTKQQAVYLAKLLLMSCVVPLNAE